MVGQNVSRRPPHLVSGQYLEGDFCRQSGFASGLSLAVSNWLSNSPPRSVKSTEPRSLEVPLTSTQNRPV
jgi:hypothetical protein